MAQTWTLTLFGLGGGTIRSTIATIVYWAWFFYLFYGRLLSYQIWSF